MTRRAEALNIARMCIASGWHRYNAEDFVWRKTHVSFAQAIKAVTQAISELTESEV